MNNDTIKVEVNYNLKDIENFQKSHLYRRISPFLLVILSLFFIGNAVMSFNVEFRYGYFSIRTLFFLILPIIFLIVFTLSLKKSAKNLLETNKFLRNTQCFQINNEGIMFFSPTCESNLSWDMLYKAVETKESFLLYISKEQAYIIPKRCFTENEGQIALLRDYIKNAPVPKEDKKSIFSVKRMGTGCLTYIIIFFVLLIVLLIYYK